MMKYNFDEIIDRRGSGSVKWDFGEKLKAMGFTERFDDDTLPLFTADMDIAVPPPIVNAMHRTADQRIYGYTMAPPAYYSAVIDWFERRHNWSIRQEEIVFCPGTVHAVATAIRAFTEPGEGVIIQRPVYYPFTAEIEGNGRVVANNQMILNDEGYYSPDLEDFEKTAQKPENRLFILCNPHNPSGRIFSNTNLKELSRICAKHNVLIVADEIHGDLIRKDSEFVPLAKVADSTGHILTCTAINKTFNTAGLAATNVVISDPVLRKTFLRTLGNAMPSPFTYNAVIAAYNECEDWLEELKIYLDGTIDWVLEFLSKEMPKVKAFRPEGTYILWMDFRGYNLAAEEIRKRIYVDANVILESGTMFDPDSGSGFERVCLASPRPMIKEAFERIAAQFTE
ncbi:MAG: pyridoxal phosphate-dependent aminotransferase [Spirochaetales bacterium]|uniref:cysteine-S-conjugate beta-lyase n=1 Tax=Candidatus Thalassospirochaeta sargassi TaxID=3119039 RepID=A0AAJ1MML8_9SPIO|nr:pyridoxal phosphate-dependent aminotransferase [Spirochaetales bacterium]